jgi:Transposase DDE domain
MSILGDIRLDSVLLRMVTAMSTRLTVVIRKLGASHKEQICYDRFINNTKVTPDKIVSLLSDEAQIGCAGKHILLVNDTTAASFGVTADRGLIGHVGESKKITGFYSHPAIGIDAATGGCLGLFGIDVWYRPYIETHDTTHLSEDEQASFKKAAKKARRHAVYETPFEDKESYRWLNVVKKAVKNCPLAARYTAVGDRESDIYEAMSGFKQANLDFVIRSSKDRNLSVSSVNPQKEGLLTDLMDGQEDEVAIHEKLYEKLNSCAIVNTYEIDLPKTNQRSAHTAKVALKYCPVTLKCPKSKQKEGYLQELPIYAVQITEYPESVVGHEKPIHWILLTSHPIETIEQALEIIQWYRYRWIIEQSFRTTKTKGLSIESSQAKSYEALAILITLALIASVQVMQLVQARDGQTHQSIETVFSPIEITCLEQLNEQLEGKTQKQQNPHPQSTLAFASWVIARLGGWAGFKSQRPPGPITMREGMIRFYNILVGFEIKLQN